jgi:hypothetical protein
LFLSKQSFWQDRLKVWKLSLELSERQKDVADQIEILKNSITDVMNFQSLRQIVFVVLLCGNEMNRGSYRGDAEGFRIDSLLKLTSTKSTSTSGNLLDFVVQQAKDLFPEALGLSSEIRECSKRLARITLDSVSSSLTELVVEFNTCQKICQRLNHTAEENDPIKEVYRLYEQGI